jgi:hypothetical protein
MTQLFTLQSHFLVKAFKLYPKLHSIHSPTIVILQTLQLLTLQVQTFPKASLV